MIRAAIVAAVAAASFALAAPGEAEARMANPGLTSAAPTAAQHVQYYRHHRRHRHCWNERVRVRAPGGYFVWRTHRRCGWRYY